MMNRSGASNIKDLFVVQELRESLSRSAQANRLLREENEKLRRKLQEARNGSREAELGEYLIARYGGRFSGLQEFLRAVDVALGPATRFGGARPSSFGSR